MKLKKWDDFIVENKINMEIPLPNDIIEISDAFIKSGKEIFLVGGAIRDYLQGKTPHDFDLVTNALPDESKSILKNFNVSDEQGKNFGVLRVYTGDEPKGYELASYRKDISKGRDTKGDEPKVEIGNHITIEDDCKRRDLTINALFYDIKNKQIVDIVGGVNDIKKGIIRAVGDPVERFNEDRLRILRVFRFTARTGGKIDTKTANAINFDNRLRSNTLGRRDNQPILLPEDNVSQERIWEEILKAWEYPKTFNKYLSLLTEFNMWPQIFPGSKINTELIDSLNFTVLIANLFKYENTEGLSEKLVQIYKIPNARNSRYGNISGEIVFLLNLLKFKPENVLAYYGAKKQCDIKDSTLLEWIRINKLNNLIKFVYYKPSVSAQELMNKGFSSKRLGDELRRLEYEKFENE